MSRDSFWQNYLKSLSSKRKVYFTVFHHYFNFFHFFFNITCIYWLGFWVITILPVCCKVDSAHTNVRWIMHTCLYHTARDIFFPSFPCYIPSTHTKPLHHCSKWEKSPGAARNDFGITHENIVIMANSLRCFEKSRTRLFALRCCTSCSISFNASPFSDELASAKKGENRSELCYRCRTQKSTNMN